MRSRNNRRSYVKTAVSLAKRVGRTVSGYSDRRAVGSFLRTVREHATNAAAAAAGAAVAQYLPTGTVVRPRADSGLSATEMMVDDTKTKRKAVDGGAVYKGKFKKVKKVYKDPFVSKGFKHVVEITGTVQDENAVYIGHSACQGYALIELFAQVMLRRLFEKAGMIINNVDDVPFYSANVNSALGWRLRIVRVHPLTGASAFDYDLAAGDTIATIVGSEYNGTSPNFPNMMVVLRDYAMGTNTNNAINIAEPTSMVLYRQGAVGVYTEASTILFRDEIVVCSCVSSIKIQNRSLGATGSGDAENVSSNPLRVMKYQFNGCPRVRDNSLPMFGYPVEKTGVLTVAATNTGSPYCRELVSPKFFWNCYGARGDKMDPGTIKMSTIKFFKAEKALRFLRGIGLSVSDDLDPSAGTKYVSSRVRGPFQFFGLEDMINVNASHKISIAYEVNRTLGLYFKTKRVRFAKGGVYQLTQDESSP